MNNWINFYYNILVDKLTYNNYSYYFSTGNYDYMLFPYNDSLEQIYSTYLFSINLQKMGIYCHEIVKTKDGNLYIVDNNIVYVLLKFHKNLDKIITLQDVLNFQQFLLKVPSKDKINWKKLWENKIDFFEYQLNQLGVSYPKIRESFGYFCGYAELAIMLLNNNIEEHEIFYIISHKRIKKNSTIFDLYNPFNMIIDSRIRDISEYYKSFFNEKETFIYDLIKTVNSLNLNSSEYYLLFVRMIYPSLYFDTVEKIIDKESDESKIDFLNDNTALYEDFYKLLYNYLINYLPNIEWLKY